MPLLLGEPSRAAGEGEDEDGVPARVARGPSPKLRFPTKERGLPERVGRAVRPQAEESSLRVVGDATPALPSGDARVGEGLLDGGIEGVLTRARGRRRPTPSGRPPSGKLRGGGRGRPARSSGARASRAGSCPRPSAERGSRRGRCGRAQGRRALGGGLWSGRRLRGRPAAGRGQGRAAGGSRPPRLRGSPSRHGRAGPLPRGTALGTGARSEGPLPDLLRRCEPRKDCATKVDAPNLFKAQGTVRHDSGDPASHFGEKIGAIPRKHPRHGAARRHVERLHSEDRRRRSVRPRGPSSTPRSPASPTETIAVIRNARLAEARLSRHEHRTGAPPDSVATSPHRHLRHDPARSMAVRRGVARIAGGPLPIEAVESRWKEVVGEE